MGKQNEMIIEIVDASETANVQVEAYDVTMEEFVELGLFAVDGLMGVFEKNYPEKAHCVAFGASLIEAIKTHKWSWEEGEE